MAHRGYAPQYFHAPMPPRYTGERGQFGPWMDGVYECLQSQYGRIPSSPEVMEALGTTGLQGNRADRGRGILAHLALQKHLEILPTLAQEASQVGKTPAAMWEALMAATFDLPYTTPQVMAQYAARCLRARVCHAGMVTFCGAAQSSAVAAAATHAEGACIAPAHGLTTALAGAASMRRE